MVLQILEEFEVDPWPHAEWYLKEILESCDVPLNEFDKKLESLLPPQEQNQWANLPVYYLIDLLVWQHKECQLFMQDTASLLEIHCIPSGIESDILKEIRISLHQMSILFSLHAEKQEKEVFLRIIRSDYCKRKKTTNPNLQNETIQAQANLFGFQKRQINELVDSIQEKICNHGLKHSLLPTTYSIFEKLERLGESVKRHLLLEQNFLFPMAMETEKLLFNMLIGGNQSALSIKKDKVHLNSKV